MMRSVQARTGSVRAVGGRREWAEGSMRVRSFPLARPRAMCRLALLVLVPAALLHGPRAAHACLIDGNASLAVNGVIAMRTARPPSAHAVWAPFTVAAAVGAGQPLRLEERPEELAAVLPTAMLRHPFRWRFGDGSQMVARGAQHRYARTGTYRLEVAGFDARGRRWVVFDSALLRVVPADHVVRENLGFTAVRLVVFLSGLALPLDAALLVLIALLVGKLSMRLR